MNASTVPLLPVVLAGPTGIGKSAIALALAERLGGEIVCGDSRQVYEGMRIGAAGPSLREQERVPHVGYHVVPPEEAYDAGRFWQDTDAYVQTIQARGRVPILVGGTGMYLRIWRYGLADVPPKDDAIRTRLEAEVELGNLPVLYEKLTFIDPEAAQAIEAQDSVRIVRALEIWELTGRKPSALRRSHGARPPRHRACWFLLDADMAWLSPRLHQRARQMYADGLLEESCALVQRLGEAHSLCKTMGYAEAYAWSLQQSTFDEALERTFRRQRQYAKRQRTWFRKETWWTCFSPETPALVETLSRLVRQSAAEHLPE